MRTRPKWDWTAEQAFEKAHQRTISKGDIVRSYDFPGSRDDCYVEGVVTEVENGDRVKVHVVRDVWRGEEQQLGSRLIVWSPLGVSSMSHAPCVFLIEKRKLKGDQ